MHSHPPVHMLWRCVTINGSLSLSNEPRRNEHSVVPCPLPRLLDSKGLNGLERQHRRGPVALNWLGFLLLKGARQPPGTAAEPGRTAGGDLWPGLRPRGEDRRCLRPPGPAPARFDSINTVRIPALLLNGGPSLGR